MQWNLNNDLNKNINEGKDHERTTNIIGLVPHIPFCHFLKLVKELRNIQN